MTGAGPAHRTVSLHEWHVVGADGLPARHRTVHVLRALRPGLATYTYRFDSREARVRAVRGCRAGAPRPDAHGLTAVDLVLPRTLAVGETAAMEYETLFDWRSVPPPQLRRGMRQRVERLDMRVEFSPLRLPARLEWAVWDGFGPDATVRAAEVVTLDAEHAAHRFVDSAEGVTVGFTWAWAPGQEPVLPRE
ncbi:hypothetical protein [Petropleomorpha daqingensis]|uniref:Uncharacterized protein n=1 Tax=Petropleomorpha daqingensis TaxID=2026353 RepID=A0A853CGW7_9ACTN|nr:hypothetical protein [Petropleomorpha daqingensis]NYJ05303.1 hypothetical protein [Petropleomorpha daqingensis]